MDQSHFVPKFIHLIVDWSDGMLCFNQTEIDIIIHQKWILVQNFTSLPFSHRHFTS